MTELQHSHAELRAAVMLAGKGIRKLNFGKADSPMLATLRRVLRDSRAVACDQQLGVRARVALGEARRRYGLGCTFSPRKYIPSRRVAWARLSPRHLGYVAPHQPPSAPFQLAIVELL